MRSCGLNLLLLLRIVVLRLLGRGERQSAGREGNEEDGVRSSHGALLSFLILPLAQRLGFGLRNGPWILGNSFHRRGGGGKFYELKFEEYTWMVLDGPPNDGPKDPFEESF